MRQAAGGTLVERRKELGATWIKFLREGTPEQKKLAIGQYGWWIPIELRLPQFDDIGAILRHTEAPSIYVWPLRNRSVIWVSPPTNSTWTSSSSLP
ncbi:hypothetical protein N9B42_02950 [Akkermansiaceae bacterium]|nr:hypothetical protein [Akkermansiaceae bacterium]